MSDTHIKDLKAELRSKIKLQRRRLDAEKKISDDRKIAENFLNSDFYRQAETIMTYVSTETEIDTLEIIKKALGDKKTVAVPVCEKELGEMSFYIIKDLTSLTENSFGISEPDKNNCEKLSDFSNALCIVPALLFDRKGHRLGYGGGYYDKFFEKFSVKKAGLCYNAFMVDYLPRADHDAPVDIIITQDEIFDIK